MPAARTVCLTLPEVTPHVEESLYEVLGEILCSWARLGDGPVRIWVALEEAGAVREALGRAGLTPVSEEEQEDRDWVREAASLQQPVSLGPFLLDPHEGELRTEPAGGQRRLFVPASRAFGTGSHESTRLAARLLLAEELDGRLVLDVGCGAGTLAFVAALRGARAVAFDLDLEAALATRENARANDVPRVRAFAGPVEAIEACGRFDVVVANMILEEIRPLLPGLFARLAPGGRLLSSGLLLGRLDEWSALLLSQGFSPDTLISENEWLGTASIRLGS